MLVNGNLSDFWADTTLEKIISVASGKSLPKSRMVDEGIPVYGGNGITGYHNDMNVIEPTIVIGRVGFYCGSVHMTPAQAWVTDNAFVTKYSKGNISRDFLLYLLDFIDLRQNVTSTAQPVISGSKLYPIKTSLPPLAEQKVIAEKLDKLLAKVDSIKARLDAVPATLKRFRQSLLAAAVSGKLTEDWRTQNTDRWSLTCLANAVDISGGKTPSKGNSEFWNGGDIVWVSPKDMKTDLIDSSQLMITNEAIVSGGMKLIPKGSVLVVTRSGILAHSFPVARTLADVTINQDIKALVPIRKHVTAEFLFLLMKGHEKLILDECSKAGTTVPSVETKLLMKMGFYLPSLEEQTEIVRRVEKLFAYADKIEAEAKAAQERVNKLTQSILAKAFRGELTAKWREQNPELISGENSAEALLAKIQAEREKLKPAKKTRARKAKA